MPDPVALVDTKEVAGSIPARFLHRAHDLDRFRAPEPVAYLVVHLWAGGRFDPDNWGARIYNHAAERAGWSERADFCENHIDHASDGSIDCRTQGTCRWQQPPHSLRHYAVTTLIAHGGLDDDDIAEIVGHTTGAPAFRVSPRSAARRR